MYSGIGDSSQWVLVRALVEAAARRPDADWVTTTDGDRLSFGHAEADMRRVATFLASLGVSSGTRVAVMLPNGCDFVRAWLGLNLLGAVAVFLNTDLKGAFLKHQIVNSDVDLAIVHASFLPQFDEIGHADVPLRRLICVGTADGPLATAYSRIDWEAWRDSAPSDAAGPSATDTAAIMYTSGTSGPAKGVCMPHAHCTLYGVGAIEALQLGGDDRYYVSMPLFHVNALFMQLGATLLAQCPAVVRRRFSASEWISDIRNSGATVTNLLGVQAAFILGQTPRSDDAEHALRAIVNAPNIPAHEDAFHTRFGVKDILSGFGMTEVNLPIWGRLGQSRPGAAGWPHADRFDVIVADPETDRERPRGQVGEILVRPKVPFGFMSGYFRLPDRTVEAWRNLWFHTGDAGVMEADGLVTFIDRIKDCIRRRGENIAAAEIEAIVQGLDGVAEAAAFAVNSDIPGGEDDVMIAVVLTPGCTTTPAEIGSRAASLLPRFANPRFVQVLEAMPKTATGKIQRDVLRRRGAGAALDRMPGGAGQA
jgi:crotonobetaine/carnitine-CoA ligase